MAEAAGFVRGAASGPTQPHQLPQPLGGSRPGGGGVSDRPPSRGQARGLGEGKARAGVVSSAARHGGRGPLRRSGFSTGSGAPGPARAARTDPPRREPRPQAWHRHRLRGPRPPGRHSRVRGEREGCAAQRVPSGVGLGGGAGPLNWGTHRRSGSTCARPSAGAAWAPPSAAALRPLAARPGGEGARFRFRVEGQAAARGGPAAGAAMAGNRLQKIGSVFSRTRDLLRIGVIEKPLWFDVYVAFPPLREPVYRVPRPRYGKVKDVIPPIFYREDEVRARFYRVYGSGPRPIDLLQSNYKSTCQRFVEKFNELKEEGKIEEEKLFEETGKALLASGIILQRRGTDKVVQQDHQHVETRDSALHLRLQTVLEEMQEKKKDQEEQMPEQAETQKENPLPS